jgi:hypothetical protein
MRLWRIETIVPACFLLFTACGKGSQPSTTPTSPISPTSSPVSVPSGTSATHAPLANWSGDAAVLSATGGAACGWGTTPGETRTGVDWRVTIGNGEVALDEDMRNFPTDDVPYVGTLNGRNFTATYSSGADYLRYACEFKGGTLGGTFSEDFSSFEAHEVLMWGPPGGETTVERRWTGSRL